MFIIARRRGQRIAIGDDIEVTVSEISRNTVKLGILAPKSCPIIRCELKDSVEQANRDALNTNLTAADENHASYSTSGLGMETNLSGANAFLQPPVKTLAVRDVNRPTIDLESPKS